MPNCDCPRFEPLALTRDAVNQRARETKSLKSRLEQIAEHPEGEHRLLRCPLCGQLWQRSLAWNWGNKEYLFCVPEIEYESWISEPFVQPDELLIFAAVVERFLENASLEPREARCRREGCREPAVKLSAFCRLHHIKNLQAARQLPQSPTGRWFAPYSEENFAVPT